MYVNPFNQDTIYKVSFPFVPTGKEYALPGGINFIDLETLLKYEIN